MKSWRNLSCDGKAAMCVLSGAILLLLAVGLRQVILPPRGAEAAGVVSRSSTLVVDGNLVPKGYQQLTVSNTSVGMTVPSGAKVARVQVLNYNVRTRDDGTDPDATTGMREFADTEFFYVGDLSVIEFIRESSDAEVNISYYDW